MNKQKLTALALGLALLGSLALIACTGEGDTSSDTDGDASTTEAVTETAPDTEDETAEAADTTTPDPETATEPVTTTAETEPETEPETVDEAAVIASVPTLEGSGFEAIPMDKMTFGKDGGLTLEQIGEGGANGVYRLVNNAADFKESSSTLSISSTTAPVSGYTDNLYAYLTISFYLPEAYAEDTSLWVSDSAYLTVSNGAAKFSIVPAENAGGNRVGATPGQWNTFEILVGDLSGDSLGFITKKGVTVYVANIGVSIKLDPEHAAVLAAIPAIPENFHPINICEYDENGKETKRNLFPGDAMGSIDPVIIDKEHELVQVFNYCIDLSYSGRSLRFMDDPIAEFRGVEGAKLVFDIYLPAEYATNAEWNIDDRAALYLAINNNPVAVAVNLEANAEAGDLVAKAGEWVHYEIPVSALGGGPFGFYSAAGTYFYYANFGIVVPD